MESSLDKYIELRPNRAGQDRAYLRSTRTRVQDLVLLHERFGQSAEEIGRRHFPHLSLAQIHAALTYFHEDRASIWAAIHEDEDFAESVRAELTGQHPVATTPATDAALPR